MRPVTRGAAALSAPLPAGTKSGDEPSVLAIKEAMIQMHPLPSPLDSVLDWIETTATEDSLALLDEDDSLFGDELSPEPLSNRTRRGRGRLNDPVDGLLAGVHEERPLDIGDDPPGEVPDEQAGSNVDAADVPSDHDTPLPREPPRAPTTVPMMLKDGQRNAAAGLTNRSAGLKKADQGAVKVPPEANHTSNEEEEWLRRQQISGVIGRMVKYLEGDAPLQDILGFRCSRRGRIMVTAVREDGRAARAGVIAGDELKSIDGWKGFQACPAHVIHSNLRAPVTLIFVGFVGKLQAEVRVKRPAEPSCGLPSGKDIVPALGSARGAQNRGKPSQYTDVHPSVQLCDEVVFKPGGTSLFISTKHDGHAGKRACQDADGIGARQDALYELHSDDARNVVQRALSSSASSPLFSI